jgi:hypothetical protein
VGSIMSNSLDKTCATWVLLGLYTIVKSYSKNNSNHLATLLETYGFLLDKPMPYGLHRIQTYCPTYNVWTCVNQRPLLKFFFL